MGIKTGLSPVNFRELTTLKNLPTTWGLRQAQNPLLSM